MLCMTSLLRSRRTLSDNSPCWCQRHFQGEQHDTCGNPRAIREEQAFPQEICISNDIMLWLPSRMQLDCRSNAERRVLLGPSPRSTLQSSARLKSSGKRCLSIFRTIAFVSRGPSTSKVLLASCVCSAFSSVGSSWSQKSRSPCESIHRMAGVLDFRCSFGRRSETACKHMKSLQL